MAGFDNDVLFADNYDYRGVVPVVAQVTTSGQLPIGTGGSPAIEVGVLTSPDNSISIGYSNPDITLIAGSQVPTVFQADTGSATPAGNILNVGGIEETSTRASGNTVNVFSPRTARYIVDPTTDRGTHTTIQGAIDDATADDTIAVRPGDYAEDITLKTGITIVGFGEGTANAGSPVLDGNISASSSGACTISGMRFEPTSDTIFTDTGTTGGTIIFNECFFLGDGTNDMINVSNSNRTLLTYQCEMSAPAGAKVVANAGGNIVHRYCTFNAAASTPSTCSSGTIRVQDCIGSYPIVSSATGAVVSTHSDWTTTNQTALDIGGSGGLILQGGDFRTGTATPINIETAGTVTNASLNSSNASLVSGAGTMTYDRLGRLQGSGTIDCTRAGAGMATQSITFDGFTNTLDHYSQGTWTPTVAGLSTAGTPTYVAQEGHYIRIGKLVMCFMRVEWSAWAGTPAGTFTVGGLPYTVSNSVTNAELFTNAVSASNLNWSGTGGGLFINPTKNTTYCSLVISQDGVTVSALEAVGIYSSGTSFLRANFQYFVD